jgi:hypothetical protein
VQQLQRHRQYRRSSRDFSRFDQTPSSNRRVDEGEGRRRRRRRRRLLMRV